MYEYLVIGAWLGWSISSLVDFFVFRNHRKTLKQRDYLLDLNSKQNDEINYLKSVLGTFDSKRVDK